MTIGDRAQRSATCIPNIGERERRKRLAAGAVMLAASLVLLGAMLALDVARWWRLILLPLFWGAASGYFQWREKT